MKEIEIAGRRIGVGYPCFIIAEAGVNHNGDLELAKRLVDAAKEASADAVKFQTWVTEKLVAPDARMAEYQRENLGRDQSQFEMLKQLEFSYDEFREIKAYADRQGILFFSTPDEEESADFLEDLGVPVFKIGSGEVTNLPFLRYVALKKKPIILSTGMSTIGEVEAAVRTIEEAGNRQILLLHCVSKYPAEPSDCNLRAMDTLRIAFQYPVGFSDHTLGIEISIAAVARGACILEKHITLDKKLPGPDHRMSLNVAEFAQMVQAIRMVEAALGTGRKEPISTEWETKQVVQKAIVAARDIPAGKILELDDLALRRTSGGLPPYYLQLLIGRKVRHTIRANQVISLDILA
jgi:N-acetylneuraminate synthase/N,N'-diacetyllegionaminate synthase